MYVSRLSLAGFRNYRALDVVLPPGLVVLQGENAQGKTNLLEALFILATSRSPRTTREGELIAWSNGQGGSAVTQLAAMVQHASEAVRLEVTLVARPEAPKVAQPAPEGEEETLLAPARGVQKRLRVNGVARRAVDYLGALRVVLFRPEDLELVTGPPAGRRRALDILLSQMDRRYTRALQRYARLLVQRNSLLRRVGQGLASHDELAPWDASLAREGASILSFRLRALEALAPAAAAFHQPLSGGAESLAVSYACTLGGSSQDLMAQEDLAGRFMEQLRASQARDVALGQTTTGPHRDDLELRINRAPANAYGSRGQQRTVALAWKLAEAQYLRAATGEDPVVLLDDVLSELDAGRRRCVLEASQEYQQVLLTSTGAELASEALRAAASFHVKNGQLTPQDV
ncbi:MAG: DNA replication/repair protein RecF [Chloroflexi bacterium]|nr:DNA replication/repair protein RecF [Chloroflexota bacterium]